MVVDCIRVVHVEKCEDLESMLKAEGQYPRMWVRMRGIQRCFQGFLT